MTLEAPVDERANLLQPAQIRLRPLLKVGINHLVQPVREQAPGGGVAGNLGRQYAA